MNFDNNLPIYLQIVNYFKGKFASGEMREGEKLPSVRELASEMKVNPNTIQRSYQELEREGLVYTQRGMGTFVTEDRETIKALKKNLAKDILSNFIKDMKSIGLNTEDIVEMIEDFEKEGYDE